MSLKSEVIALSISNDERTIDIPLYNMYNVILRNRIDAIGIHMELLFNDETDLKNILPIKGGEIIHLIVNDAHGNQIDKEFKLININSTGNHSSNENPTIVEAVESQGFELMHTRKYQNFNNKKISDVLKNILPSGSEIEPTKNKINMTNPNWTINKFVQNLSNRAINTKDKISYLFFQDTDGFKFKSLETIMDDNKDLAKDYIFDDYNPDYRYNILDWMDTSKSNLLDEQTHNVSNNKYVAYDPDAKAFKTKEVKAKDLENTKLGKGASQSQDVRERDNTKVVIVDYHGEDDFENAIKNDVIFKGYNRTLELLLNFDLAVKVGTVINVLVPSKNDSTELSNTQAGKWLVKRIAHQFNTVNAYTKIEVVRNGAYNDEVKQKGTILE